MSEELIGIQIENQPTQTIEQLKAIQYSTRNLLIEAKNEMTFEQNQQAKEYLEKNSQHVRSEAIKILEKITKEDSPGILDQYSSMGLTFLPNDTSQTHPSIKVRDSFPKNPFSNEYNSVLYPAHRTLQAFYNKTYRGRNTSGRLSISLIPRSVFKHNVRTQGQMLKEFFMSGELPEQERAKIHETAHCSNSFGFDYEQQGESALFRTKQKILENRGSAHANKMYEVHSMLAEYILSGVFLGLRVDSVSDLPKAAMAHPNVSGYQRKGLEVNQVFEMARKHIKKRTQIYRTGILSNIKLPKSFIKTS